MEMLTRARPEVRAVSQMARTYLNSVGLTAWHFRFNSNKRRLGVCKYRSRTIELSVHVLPLGWAQIEDTIKHEAAHALVGPGHHHNSVWARKARELGAKPERCVNLSAIGGHLVEPRFIQYCINGCWETKRHKRKLRAELRCKRCLGGVGYKLNPAA